MKIAIACDHGGFEYKELLVKYLKDNKIEYKDYGCYSVEAVDYPDTIYPCAKSVGDGLFDKGIVICGTGIGVSIVANKVNGVRCALVNDDKVAITTREHNDSNVLAMGARVISSEMMFKIVDNWLNTPFSNEDRHIRRINKISALEIK